MSYAMKEVMITSNKASDSLGIAASRSAILVKDIGYAKDGEWIAIPAGTAITVDASSGIALIGDDHTDVSSDEYIFQ